MPSVEPKFHLNPSIRASWKNQGIEAKEMLDRINRVAGGSEISQRTWEAFRQTRGTRSGGIGIVQFRKLCGLINKAQATQWKYADFCHPDEIPQLPQEMQSEIAAVVTELPLVGETLVSEEGSDEGLNTDAISKPRMTIGILITILVIAVPLLAFLAKAHLWPVDAKVTQPQAPITLKLGIVPKGERFSVPIEEASLPIQPGDSIQVVAEADTPRYIYLFWLDAVGELTPMWPWPDMNWDDAYSDEPLSKLTFPEGRDHFELQPDHSGIQSVIAFGCDSPQKDFEGFRKEIANMHYETVALSADSERLLVSINNGVLDRSEFRTPIMPSRIVEARHPVLQLQEVLEKFNSEKNGISTFSVSFAFAGR